MAAEADKVKGIVDGLATPFERASARADELFTLFNKGLLDAQQLEGALGMAFNGVFGNTGPQLPGVLQAGSQQALSAEHKSDASAVDPQKEIVKLLIEANRQNQRVIQLLENPKPLFNVGDANFAH